MFTQAIQTVQHHEHERDPLFPASLENNPLSRTSRRNIQTMEFQKQTGSVQEPEAAVLFHCQIEMAFLLATCSCTDVDL